MFDSSQDAAEYGAWRLQGPVLHLKPTGFRRSYKSQPPTEDASWLARMGIKARTLYNK
jgi:hypothetical protein